jgi:hypothetical protein
MPASDDFSLDWSSPCHIDDEGGDQVAQVEALVEPVGKGSKIGLGVLAELQSLEGPSQRGLEVAQHGVDPLELGKVTRLECADHPGHVDAARIGDGRKTRQPVAGDNCGGQQAGLGPLGDGLAGEALDQVKLQAHRLARGVERHRRHERHLVLRASARLAPVTLTTKVGVVKLYRAAQSAGSFLLRHGVVDLVMQQPGGGVAHT